MGDSKEADFLWGSFQNWQRAENKSLKTKMGKLSMKKGIVKCGIFHFSIVFGLKFQRTGGSLKSTIRN